MRVYQVLSAVLLALLALPQGTPASPVAAQAGERCFAETSFCIGGRIREFWEQNGGLPVFGFPIGPQQQDEAEGRTLTMQWFERNRLELHPENQPPYDVLLGRLGADSLRGQGRSWEAFAVRAEPGDCRRFAETGHSVCGPFLRAWQSSGLEFDGKPGISAAESLALWGVPLSPPMAEVIAGQVYTVQHFERARFELHPENTAPSDVLFGLLGNELRTPARPRPIVGSDPDELTLAGETLFFAANDGVNGTELWRSDGSDAGTRLVSDLVPGSESGFPHSLTALGTRLLFAARSNALGNDALWLSDGTDEGTAPLLPPEQLANPTQLTRLGAAAYFVAEDEAHGLELWRSDGTAEGTRLLKDIYPGPTSSYPRQTMPMGYLGFLPTAVGQRLFFSADSPDSGYGLWVSDGTEAGTTFVSHLTDGQLAPEFYDLTNLDGTLLFVARTGRLAYGLWRSDGTAAGTRLVADFSYAQDPGDIRLYPPVGGLRVLGGKLYFTAGDALWASDGTPGGTRQVTERPIRDAAFFDGAVFLLASRAGGGLDLLCLADDAPTLVSTVAEELEEPGGSLYVAGERLYITALRGYSALWVSDGTAAGTSQVVGIGGPWLDALDGGMTIEGQRQLVLVGDDPDLGLELWRSNGTATASGTALIADINPARR